MFTGIIQATARVERSVPREGRNLVTIQRPPLFTELAEGASIACDGICLTVLKFDGASFTVEVMGETLAKTTASAWNANTMLNLERALRIGDRLDGHWVLGHVDRTSKLLEKRISGSTSWLRFELDSRDRHLVVPQGSIAINGVSLTIAGLKPSSFTVALISHTLENTNLARLSPGSAVNLEYDILGKYVQQISQTGSKALEDLYAQDS